jgi:hypothetical protein
LDSAGGEAADSWLTLGGQRIAVDVTAIEQRGSVTKPRLRFDKVALRLVGGLQTALSKVIPDGVAVVLTVTAPIRLPAKTKAALESTIRDCLAHPSGEVRDTIHGNQIRVRPITEVSPRMPKLIGFVHNPDSDPDVLLDLTQSLARQIGAAADRHRPETVAGNRWLVVASEDEPSQFETYRQVYAQLAAPTGFEKILIVFAGGRVETLAG